MVLTVRRYRPRGLAHRTRAGRGSGGASGIMIGRRKLTASQNNQDQDETDKPTHIALLRDAMKIGSHSGERNVSECLIAQNTLNNFGEVLRNKRDFTHRTVANRFTVCPATRSLLAHI
jgi:hypothetical protein